MGNIAHLFSQHLGASEFKASLIYRANSKTERDRERDREKGIAGTGSDIKGLEDCVYLQQLHERKNR